MNIFLVLVALVVGAVLGFWIAAEAAASAIGGAFGCGNSRRNLPLWLFIIIVLGLLTWFLSQYVRIA